MRNIYCDAQEFKRAMSRNKIKSVYFYCNQFWFYTRKAVWCYQSNEPLMFNVWLKAHCIAVDERGEIR